MKIIILTNDFSLPVDEGRKKAIQYLMTHLSKKEEVLTICTGNGMMMPSSVKQIKTNRLLINLHFKKEITYFRPDLIVYVPTSSASIGSLIRATILKGYGVNAKIIMIAHSGPIKYRKQHRILLRLFSLYSSLKVLTPSPQLYEQLKKYRYNVQLVPLGVDINKFKPVEHKTKLALRERYGLGKEDFIALHVGHITKSRNLEIFNTIQKISGVQVLIVASETVPKDKEILERLKSNGVKLITTYIDRIEEVYQLSDCYVFLGGAISMPLSVMEAMACNMSVITTKFGILPVLFKEGNGFTYCELNKDVIDKIIQNKNLHEDEIGTRALVEPYSWEKFVKRICNT